MQQGELPEVLQSLISHHTPSMDHIAILLALRAAPDQNHETGDVARETRLDRHVVEQVLGELTRSGLLEQHGGSYRYAPAPAMATSIDALAEMYHTKPVTLVRAIYDRPKRAVQSFADAFRLRKEDT